MHDDAEATRLLRGRILCTLAYQMAELGRIPDAMELLERAAASHPDLEPLVIERRASILVRTGRPDEALSLYDAAVSGLASSQRFGQEHLADALLNRGVLHMNAGRIGQAAADTEAAIRVANDARIDVVVFMATHNLGYVRYLGGDLPGALESMDAASRLFTGDTLGVALLDRARVLLAAGLILVAQDFADRALAEFEHQHATADLLELLKSAPRSPSPAAILTRAAVCSTSGAYRRPAWQ